VFDSQGHRFAGPRSSALVGGYTQQHAELEAALAQLKGAAESAFSRELTSFYLRVTLAPSHPSVTHSCAPLRPADSIRRSHAWLRHKAVLS